MAYSSRYMRRLVPYAYRTFGKNRADRIIKKAKLEYNQLCEENAERDTAAEILNNFYEKQNEPTGTAIRIILRIPALYKFVPRFFTKMTKISFGENAGFRARWLQASKKEMRFDMLVCPSQNLCVKYGCPEIVRGFCRSDDICYGNMHRNHKNCSGSVY